MLLPLAKFQMSYQWDESKHTRDDAGRFASSGGGSLPMATVARPQSRSLTRGESWQRIGAKIAELPTAYTGSKDREAPADWFKAPPKIEWQAPKALSGEQHTALVGKLKGIIQSNRQDAIAKAKETRQLVAVHGIKDRFTLKRRTGDLILPPDTPPGAVNRAYNHAAMLALHDFGALDYDFQMSDPQKEELTPLIPFMRYTRRRLWNEMRTGDLKGASQPYRAEFGKPFADQRRDKRTGAVRMRLRPNDVLVKRTLTTLADIRSAARMAATPTLAQREAGNYRKGHVTIDGLNIAIETPKGGWRRGQARNGRKWQVRLPAHYGYVKGSEGADGDHVDVYLGPRAHQAEQHPVFVVDQINTHTGKFDEHKCFLGFADQDAAVAAYDAAFSDGKGPERRSGCTEMSWADFKAWVRSDDTKKPLVKAFDETKVKRDDDGKFASKAGAFVQPFKSPVNQAILGSVLGAAAVPSINMGIVAGAAMPRGTYAARRIVRGLAQGGKSAAYILPTALALASLAAETTAAIRRRPQDGWVGPGWKERGEYLTGVGMGAVGAAGLLALALKDTGRSLAIISRAVPKIAGNAVSAAAPPLGRALKLDRASRLNAVRSAIKATPGKVVWRGAPAAHDFAPIHRGYTAVYAATNKKVTRGFGANSTILGSVTAFKLSPKAKLLDTGTDFPGQYKPPGASEMPESLVPLYERLVAAGHNKRFGSTRRDFGGLSALHTNPTEAQNKILEEAGYHGTIGRSKNVAVFDTSLLTPLYAQDRVTGTLTFPKKPLTKKAWVRSDDTKKPLVKAFDETKVKRDDDGKFASKAGAPTSPSASPKPTLDDNDDYEGHAEAWKKMRENFVRPFKSPVNQAILGSVLGAAAVPRINMGIVAGAAMPRGTYAARRIVRGLAQGGKGAAYILPLALALASVAAETTAAIRRRPQDGWVGPGWKERGQYLAATATAAAGGAMLMALDLKNNGRSLAIISRAVPKIAGNAVSAAAPPLGRALKLDRASRLNAVRSAIKATPGKVVWRGAPAAHDFAPIQRGYTAVYAATNKTVTRGYGANREILGSVTAFKLSPKAKLLDTGTYFPGHFAPPDASEMPESLVPLYERLVAAGQNKGSGSTARDFGGLSALHTEPTEAQKKILEEAGYHGTIGRSKNVAVFDTSLLTPLYAQDRVTGTLTFPKKPLTKAAPDCVDERVATQVQEADRVLASAAPRPGAARRRIDPHVASVMADVDRLLGPAPVQETPELRLKRNAMVADLRIPLADVLRRAT